MKTFFASLALAALCLSALPGAVQTASAAMPGDERGFYTQASMPTNGVLAITNAFAAGYASPMLARLKPVAVAVVYTNGATSAAVTHALSKVSNGITVPTWTNGVVASNATSVVFTTGPTTYLKAGDILVLTASVAPASTNRPVVEVVWE